MARVGSFLVFGVVVWVGCNDVVEGMCVFNVGSFIYLGQPKALSSLHTHVNNMTMCRLDSSAHRILKGVRDGMKRGGIAGATLSDAIRRLDEMQRREVRDEMDG